jgi:hypothetical protein
VLRNLPGWAVHEATHFDLRGLLTRASGHLRKILNAPGASTAGELDPRIYFGKSSLSKSYQGFLTAMYRAMLAYVPGPYEGPMIVLRAQRPTLFRTTDRKMGWQAVVAGTVQVHDVPGSHDDCASARHGAELARVLKLCSESWSTPPVDATPSPVLR